MSRDLAVSEIAAMHTPRKADGGHMRCGPALTENNIQNASNHAR
jgi:hypothetical protein